MEAGGGLAVLYSAVFGAEIEFLQPFVAKRRRAGRLRRLTRRQPSLFVIWTGPTTEAASSLTSKPETFADDGPRGVLSGDITVLGVF